MSDVVDSAVLAAIEAAGVTVHDGLVPTDSDGATITSSMPYAVLWSNMGDDNRRSVAGRPTTSAVEFRVTYVGVDRWQAKWCAAKVRDAVRAVAAGKSRPTLQSSTQILPDRDARVLSGGKYVTPFYGSDTWSVLASPQ